MGSHSFDASAQEQETLESVFCVFVAPPAVSSDAVVRLESVSSSDTVMSLRQLLVEFPALACYTCYHLEAQNLRDDTWQTLNDFVELGEYETVKDGVTLRMVPDTYDARKVRAHVRRFRDVQSNPPIPQAALEHAATQVETVEEGPESKEKEEEKLKEMSEQQLKRLREIHHKLEGIEVPVVPDLVEFYSFPGAKESEQEQVPVATKGKDPKKKKGKKTQPKPKQQQQNETNQVKNKEPQPDATLPVCVKSIVFSGYNPPPGPRKLAGDLLYLEVVVAGDNTHYHITAHVNGFYVNRSTATKFDPQPLKTDTAHAHLLIDLLSTVSPKFRESYAALLAKAASLAKEGPSSIEWMVATGSNLGGKLPWNTPASTTMEHKYDLNRAEDELCVSYGMDERGVMRDWNEEYQCCRELPTDTLKEEIVRARVMYKVVAEFVEAATQGAVAIVEGNISPINPMDEKSAHVYVFNNIFFSISIDGKSIKDAAGGEENAYSAANRDLQGVKAFNEADVRGLHTLATTVVDYLGVRVIAQSLIPGILMGDAASKLVYGSVDHGKTIAASTKMHSLMLEAGAKLHIAERSIKPLGKSEEDLAAEKEQEAIGVLPMSGGDASTDVATICGAVEAKGIQGSDGRLYVLDLVRITPKDWTFYKNCKDVENTDEKTTTTNAAEVDGLCFTHKDEGYVALLRPELVHLYSLWKQNQARRANREARKAAKAEVEKKKEEDDAKTDSDKENSTPGKTEMEKSEHKTEVDEEEEEIPPMLLNPNVFMEYTASTDTEQLKTDEMAAKDAAEYLQKIVVPAFVADVRRSAIAPADGYALTQLMHSCGINMRYLGRLASLAKKLEAINGISKYLLELIEVEMISRVAKHILADVLNSNDSIRAAPGSAIVKLLNGILGSASGNTDILETNDEDDATITTSSLDPKSLWACIDNEIKARFDYKLTLWGPGRDKSIAEEAAFPVGRVNKTVMLRRLCQRLGLRVKSRNYKFSSSLPITLDDITGVVPVVKTSLPAHPLAQAKKLLERGRLHLSQGALSSAYEFLQEASSLLFQVCGAAHEDAALCSSSLATVLYHAGDVGGAIAQQQRALALYTQLQGADYHDTAYAHANIALFLHANAQTDLAVPHIRRAIYLLEFCCGPHFPEISSLYFKMGMMCQDVGQISLALMCHRESLRRGEFDRNQAANTLHQMALACSLAGGYREALAYEKKVYLLFKEAFGDEDPRVVESAKFMAKFTEKAVEGAKGRREVDAAAAADAIANQLLGELEIKTGAGQDTGSPSAAKKKSRKSRSGGKKH